MVPIANSSYLFGDIISVIIQYTFLNSSSKKDHTFHDIIDAISVDINVVRVLDHN